ncbi:uncharacterized protein EHS24_002401 [Apiotrichum porosum]|uniref:Transcriptional regulator n=1 Tax=Apiotrichum porosum TaxID=105984 RepID=A0A427XIQ9_9TREE|nr:uncharacterized protein EHS24_002401 [Apiotrichum porosum]RSH78672.1 hypothetical protein EHS24_002401 [Apiotrichum porosum]
MHIRPHFAEIDVPTLHQFIRANPLGMVTTAIQHPTFDTLQSSHIPFLIDAPENTAYDELAVDDRGHRPPGSLGVLRGHMGRNNPQTRAILDSVKASGSNELADPVLVLFTAEVHSYITPRWYTAARAESGKLAPTWQYSGVQVYGRLRVHHTGEDASNYLQRQVEDLTHLLEPRVPGKGWEISDASPRFIELIKKGIVGLELSITKIEGRIKMGQDETDGDWQGVVDGFKAEGTEKSQKMVDMMLERAKGRPGREAEQ